MARPDRHFVLVIGDLLALLAFALIGLASHDRSIGAHGLFRDAVPVIAGWILAAGIFDAYRRRGPVPFLETWLVGVGGGVLVRGLILHRHVLGASYLTFLAVALVTTLLLLLVWRGSYRFARNRIDSRAAARNDARS